MSIIATNFLVAVEMAACSLLDVLRGHRRAPSSLRRGSAVACRLPDGRWLYVALAVRHRDGVTDVVLWAGCSPPDFEDMWVSAWPLSRGLIDPELESDLRVEAARMVTTPVAVTGKNQAR